jgi:predicted HAD superfamily Cof-like phosphohydrolase
MNTLDLVKQFYKAAGDNSHLRTTPHVPPPAQALLKVKFMNEELAELSHAFCAEDTVKIIDALTDLQYFLDGIYLLCGMGDLKDQAFEEVHRSNMTKFIEQRNIDGNPTGAYLCLRDDAGKIRKPETYTPPNLKQFLP